MAGDGKGTDMTPEQIEQMKAALEGATAGPWWHERNNMWGREFGYTVEIFETYGPDENENFLHDIALSSLAPDMAAHIIAQREQIEALQKRVKAALERLDASLFTNAEHQQAKAILRATGGQDNGT